MKRWSVISGQWSVGRQMGAAVCLLLMIGGQLACSIPNPESQQCSEARDSAKEFYSWYLGTDAEQRTKQPDVFRKFISPNSSLNTSAGEIDPFFNSETAPTTFKIGKCEMVDSTHTNIQIQLYWREGAKTEQKEVYAGTVKSGDRWLIEKVESR
jgi:hypothetical protein